MFLTAGVHIVERGRGRALCVHYSWPITWCSSIGIIFDSMKISSYNVLAVLIITWFSFMAKENWCVPYQCWGVLYFVCRQLVGQLGWRQKPVGTPLSCHARTRTDKPLVCDKNNNTCIKNIGLEALIFSSAVASIIIYYQLHVLWFLFYSRYVHA